MIIRFKFVFWESFISSTDAAGNTTKYEYGSNGLVSKITDPKGGSTSYTYDAMRRTKTVTDGVSQAGYTYSKDLLTQISVGGGSLLYNFTYDSMGRKTAVSVGNSAGSRKLASYTYQNNLMTRQTYGASGKLRKCSIGKKQRKFTDIYYKKICFKILLKR